jgi:hypothetical protein
VATVLRPCHGEHAVAPQGKLDLLSLRGKTVRGMELHAEIKRLAALEQEAQAKQQQLAAAEAHTDADLDVGLRTRRLQLTKECTLALHCSCGRVSRRAALRPTRPAFGDAPHDTPCAARCNVVHADWAECLSRLQAAMARLRAREHIGATTTGRPQVSQKGQLLSRRGCGLPANASALDTHRDSTDSPAGLAWSPCRTTTATSCSRGWGGGGVVQGSCAPGQ